ncbi:hypothetical protein [Clostridium felsineum]|uniref:hypothetical protein n=1 Tax=Clostridium felsineum TaxID=36839 RepID=UPI00098C320A|nr:hypothetical protein [Clostridium felsineum]URZ15200.1 hypothetical protein CLFE_012180 [Clostridium felsineum DSM 794]
MKVYKVLTIIFYLIAGSMSFAEIYGTIMGNYITINGYLSYNVMNLILYLIAIVNHRKYRALRRVCKELLDGKNVEKIDYMIKDHKFYKGGDYYILEYYIEEKPFTMKATKMDCRNNKNNEYYIRPVYDRKGRVKELVPYMDKKNVFDKEISYERDLENYKEMQRLKEEKEEEKPKHIESKELALPKTKSKRMKKKYNKQR